MSEWLGESFLQKNWANVKNPPKMRYIQKIRENDGSHACNDLTDFEYVVHAMTGNGSYLNLHKLT
jgi:hypothetical protein